MISVCFKVCGFYSVSAPLPAYFVSAFPSKSGTAPNCQHRQYTIKKTYCQDRFCESPLFAPVILPGNRFFFPGLSQAVGIPVCWWCSRHNRQFPYRWHCFRLQGQPLFSTREFLSDILLIKKSISVKQCGYSCQNGLLFCVPAILKKKKGTPQKTAFPVKIAFFTAILPEKNRGRRKIWTAVLPGSQQPFAEP